MPLRDFSLTLFSKIFHLLPRRNHPKHSASTPVVVELVANRQCVLWSTPGRWFLLCLASWESIEPNTETITLLVTWWGSHLCQSIWISREMKQSQILEWFSHVADVVFNSLQRAALYWIQTLIFSRKWGVFVKSAKQLVPTHNLWSPEEHSVCLQVTPKAFNLA